MKLSKKVSNDSLYEPKNIKKESRKSKLSLTLSKRKKSKLIDKLSFMLMWV